MKTEIISCYMSEVGHKNFYYPTSTKMLIRKGCTYETLPWVSGNKELIAAKIKISCILPTSFDKDPACAILRSRDKDTTIVVWIDKK
jgi:hypothetical protein